MGKPSERYQDMSRFFDDNRPDYKKPEQQQAEEQPTSPLRQAQKKPKDDKSFDVV